MKQKIVPIVGLEKLYVAKILKDDETGVEFDTPRYLPGIKEITINPSVNQESFYAENIEWLNDSTLENIEVGVNITDLIDEDESFLLGHKLAEEGGVIKSADDVAPDVAILLKANKGKGEYRYQVLYKGNFGIGEAGYKGKEGTTEFGTKHLTAKFAPLRSNKRWQYKVDSDSPNAPIDLDTSFFSKVIMPVERIDDGSGTEE